MTLSPAPAAHDRTQLLTVISLSEPEYVPEPQRVEAAPESLLMGAFDFGYHRYLVYRQGDRGVWVYMHPWRRKELRQAVGAVVSVVTDGQHAVFSRVESEGQLVFDPASDTAVTVEEVAAAYWSHFR